MRREREPKIGPGPEPQPEKSVEEKALEKIEQFKKDQRDIEERIFGEPLDDENRWIFNDFINNGVRFSREAEEEKKPLELYEMILQKLAVEGYGTGRDRVNEGIKSAARGFSSNPELRRTVYHERNENYFKEMAEKAGTPESKKEISSCRVFQKITGEILKHWQDKIAEKNK